MDINEKTILTIYAEKIENLRDSQYRIEKKIEELIEKTNVIYNIAKAEQEGTPQNSNLNNTITNVALSLLERKPELATKLIDVLAERLK